MVHRPKHRIFRTIIGSLAVTAGLAIAPSALGLAAPAPVNSSIPPSPAWTAAGSSTFSWGAPLPDFGCVVTRYGGGLSGAPDTNFGAATSTALALPTVTGDVTFRVQAFEQWDGTTIGAACLPLVEVPSDYGTVTLRIDKTLPVPPTPVAPVPAAGQTVAVVNSQRPTFDWSAGRDDHSGLAGYQVLVSGPGVGLSRIVATTDRNETDAVSNTTLPVGVDLTYRVRALDNVGNGRDFAKGPIAFRVELPAPPPSPGTPGVPGGGQVGGSGTSASGSPAKSEPRKRAKLPTRNAKRLKPRAGRVVPTTRPVLRWANGPRRTTIYNVQVFRVKNPFAKTADDIRLDKIRSIFPTSTQVRVGKLTRGRCYVWRVWPYLATDFTSKPLGLSHFCVAAKPKKSRR